MGRKGYHVRDGLFFLPITPRRVVSFSSSARRDRGLLRLSECRAVLAWAMPSVSNLVDRQLSPCDGGVIVHTLIIRHYVLKNILSSTNPLGLQPLPLYFTYVKHMGRKGYHASARGLINGLKNPLHEFFYTILAFLIINFITL